MTVRRLAPVDAQTYWMSAAIPNDQFLLYGFAADSVGVGRAVQEIEERSQRCAELRLRICDDRSWRYPAWESREVGPDQFVVHELAERTWRGCLAAVTELADHQLEPREMTWRLHVFPDIEGIPDVPRGTVAVLQVCHALADGVRSSALAGYLFGRVGPGPGAVSSPHTAAGLPARALAAARGHRRLVRDTAAGVVPPQAVSVPALRSNARPSGPRHVRTVFCTPGHLPGPTVTVGVLSAVSTALSGHLRELGDDPSLLGAEVPMARTGPRLAHNHFGNVSVGLYPDADAGLRIRRIVADLRQRRRRAAHPAMRAESAAFASIPAPILRWGVRQFDPEVRSPTVAGNTVVSSVNRGAKDLRFGGAPVLVTAGFPGLSPMMGVTHGVHGIGDTIAVSVHAAESAIGEVDAYLQRLEHALRDQV
ncbi:Uncharacterised protein [Mycolicibacterium vanbaalenii]|uniref:O-acyltransferase WSD1 C-terminal domain-containing protein n=1 Tax=Mycolicibacterium vanbaalenii TaxID=110539 RepID=A0A5S9R630_MYCVN|nr:WS/DGAT domain-containing protein [Mycolicibacterium vanbaalenii]CAA0131929.1 Uncharacterised protein [Mycolicibacterium vanbaalenii]